MRIAQVAPLSESVPAGTTGAPSGSVPEVLSDGVTGFVVEDLHQTITAVERVGEVDRRRCRETFEERFSARSMADDYVPLYARVMRRESGTLVRRAEATSEAP